MKRLALVLTVALSFGPIAAQADDFSGCLLGPSELHRCSISGVPAAAMAAFALPALTVGAIVTLVNDVRGHERPVRGVVQTKTASGKAASHLLLLPPATDPYREAAGDERPRKPAAQPSPMLHFNEAATTATLAVAGAMAIGAFIATVVGGKKK